MQDEQTVDNTVNVPIDLGTRNDVYEWCVVYDDDTELHEYDESGQHGWKDIDLPRMKAFILKPQKDGLQQHVLHIDGNARPIFFRRRRIELNVAQNFEQEGDTVSITVLGWQSTVQGVNVASYTAFYFDGSVKVTNNPDLI